jgi:PTH1 family peptidyl-tRNA hydrolase
VAIELVIGLGNPGPEYAATRHNVGFRVVDELARRLRATGWRHRFSSRLTSTGRGRQVWLAKPTTYMNRSGDAAVALTRGLDLGPANLLVVVDDVDLPVGRIRLRKSGGSGTHNGLRDLVDVIGTGFARLRVGVGGEDASGDLADYVLSPFDAAEEPVVDEAIARAADAVETALFEGFGRAMNRFNRRPEKEGEGPAE